MKLKIYKLRKRFLSYGGNSVGKKMLFEPEKQCAKIKKLGRIKSS
jgi:hypothetical protein